MTNEDIRSRAGSIFRDAVNMGRQQSRIVSTNGISASNPKLIIWSAYGLPSNMRIPDLIMRINPQNLRENYSQIITRKRTLGGFVEEYWGEQMDSISASGITSSFINEKGLTNEKRRDTLGFLNFQSLVDFYRNNGSIYDQKTGAIIAQGSIAMTYDSVIRHGYFENFSLQEDALKPYNLMYEFSFKVTYEQSPGRKQSFNDVTPVSVSQTNIVPVKKGSLDNVSVDILGNYE